MENKKQLLISTLVTILYALITLIFVLHHEIWADEAQVWLIAKHVSFLGLFKHLVNEGHPSFFYLLIMPAAKFFHGAGAIFFMQFVCWFSSCAAVFLLLRYSPFSGFAKFSIITSAGFLYFFPVIARSYSVLPLLVFLGAILYKDSKKHPLAYAVVLALIANTHVIMFGFCAVLALFFFFDNIYKKPVSRSSITAAAVMAIGLFAVVLQLAKTEASNGAIEYTVSNFSSAFVRVVVQFFANSVDYMSSIQLSRMTMPSHPVLYFVVSAVLLVLFVILLIYPFFAPSREGKKIFALGFLSTGFQFAIYIFAYSAIIYPTRAFSAFLILIFCYWILLEKDLIKKKTVNFLLGVFFLLTCFNGLHFAMKDLKYNYSSAKETAEFVQKNIEEDAVIFPTIDAFPLAVYLYTPQKYYRSVYTNRQINYMVWYITDIYNDKNFEKIYTGKLDSEIKRLKLENKKIYVIASSFFNKDVFEKIMPEKYTLVYKSGPSLALGEEFKIYEYKAK